MIKNQELINMILEEIEKGNKDIYYIFNQIYKIKAIDRVELFDILRDMNSKGYIRKSIYKADVLEPKKALEQIMITEKGKELLV